MEKTKDLLLWGKSVRWITPFDRQKVQTLVSIIESLQLSLEHSNYINKLTCRISALEKVVSLSHSHTLDYKCFQCTSLKQAKIELSNLDGNK